VLAVFGFYGERPDFGQGFPGYLERGGAYYFALLVFGHEKGLHGLKKVGQAPGEQ
jgi:hypothetical protein